MGDLSVYPVRTSVTGTDRIPICTSASDAVNSCTLAQIASLGGSGNGGQTSGPTRPNLSAFQVFNESTLVQAQDVANGPIVVTSAAGGTYLSLTAFGQPVSGSEWMVTAQFTPTQLCNLAGDYSFFSLGLLSNHNELLVLRYAPGTTLFQIAIWSNFTTFNTDISGLPYLFIERPWFRIYYQASDTATPYKCYASSDGISWTFLYAWNGTTDVANAPFIASDACALIDPGNAGVQHTGALGHWDIQEGAGSSLNPTSIVFPT